MMAQVVIYTKTQCPYCDLAKKLLVSKQIAFEEIRVDLDPEKLSEMIAKSNRRSVPEIFINDQLVGGYDDLAAIAKSGKLDTLINS
jgi:glutaredoxin 3